MENQETAPNPGTPHEGEETTVSQSQANVGDETPTSGTAPLVRLRAWGQAQLARCRQNIERGKARLSRMFGVLRHNNQARYKFALVCVLLLVVLGAVAAGTYALLKNRNGEPVQYAATWSLVEKTVSQNATIRINPPVGTTVPDPSSSIAFTPKLKGTFSQATDGSILFDPAKPLVLGAYYSVELTAGEVPVRATFKAAEDPKVLMVLPNKDAEAHEETKISILFNRPMVPLTTLTERDALVIPVELTPATPGRWVWKSTRMLQFIPETRLYQATTYTVKSTSALQSVEGLAVPTFEHTFTTRTLKVRGSSGEELLYNQPLRISFNIPVDLARTAGKIHVRQGDREVPAHVRYVGKKEKKRGWLGLAYFAPKEDEDASQLEIIPAQDSNGRSDLWDFDTKYTVELEAAYPIEGNLSIEKPRTFNVTVPSVLAGVEAQSDRSHLVSTTMFDPEGKLIARFHEAIDIKKLQLSIKGKSDVRYAQTCQRDDDGNEVVKVGAEECEKVDDEQAIEIRVQPDAWSIGEANYLVFERITAKDGTVVNVKPITIPIRKYAGLELFALNPGSDAQSASLTELELCTSVPLATPEREKLGEILRFDNYRVFAPDAWQPSYLLLAEDVEALGKDTVCKAWQYRTIVRYGLNPNTKYALSLSLGDDFGQTVARDVSFTTQDLQATYARLLQVQPMYSVTVPGRTKLTFGAENLEDATVHICKVSALSFLKVLEAMPNEYTDERTSYAPCVEEKTIVVDLPDRYFVNNYFQVDVGAQFANPLGQYIVTVYDPEFSKKYDGPRYLHSFLSVTTLAVGQKTIGWYRGGEEPADARSTAPAAQDLYLVLRSMTLDAISGASITAYESKSMWGEATDLSARPSVVTGADGVARAPAKAGTRGAVVTYNGESAVVAAWADNLSEGWSYGGETRTYLYSDRPIYRPGDTVHIKGIDRVGYDGSYRVVSDVQAKLTIRDSTGEEVYQADLPVSDYGTFDTAFDIPRDAPLGTWNMDAFGGSGWFDVEEYAPSAFKLELTPSSEEYVAGDTLKINVDAQYWFGLPVTSGVVEYDIVAQDYYFDRVKDDLWWRFSGGWYYCYECGYGDSFLRRGKTALDVNGQGTISLPLNFAEYFKDADTVGGKIFTVNARVKDDSGRQVGASKSAIVHRAERYLGLRTDTSFAGKNTPVTYELLSVDTKGTPVALSGITRTVYKLDWKQYKRREVDGGFYWHNEEVKTVVGKTELRTDATGRARDQYTFTEEGEYEIEVLARDSRNNPIRTTMREYVWGDGQVPVEQTNNTSLDVKTDKQSYKVNETGRVLFESPFARAKALITLERGDIFDYQIIDVQGSIVSAEFPIRELFVPNAYVSVLLLSPNPEVRSGTAEFAVETQTRELTVDVKADKSHYLPGEKMTLQVRTTNTSGAPVAADVSIAVADLSVLALKGNPKKNPLVFFYDGKPLAVTTRSNLKNVLFERDIPTGTKGGGGGDPEDLSKKKRGDFRDTAFWQARVLTAEDGTATVSFTLPDNLTTWQIESLGVTKDLLLGVDYDEVMSKKELMVIPKKPRFILPGDSFSLGAQVMNDTNETVSVTVHVDAPTLTLLGKTERVVKVKAHESALVYTEVVAPREKREGVHTVTWRAAYAQGEDTVEQTIPIARDFTFETVATAGVWTERDVTEYLYIPNYALADGEVTIRARATLASLLAPGIEYLAHYPYGCAEQIASSLAALALAKRIEASFGEAASTTNLTLTRDDGESASVDEALAGGLEKLYRLQAPSGGFAYYAGLEENFSLTLEVLRALGTLEEAGVAVRPGVMARAASYAQREFSGRPGAVVDDGTVALMALAFSYKGIPEDARDIARPYVERIADNSTKLETLPSIVLAYLSLAAERGDYSRGVRRKLFAALENRLALDARGAYIQTNARSHWHMYGTTEKTTGLFLSVAALHDAQHPAAGNVLRWLLASRDMQRAWGTTNATFSVLEGALAVAVARGENDPDFDLSLFVDGAAAGKKSFAKSSVFESLDAVVPVSALPREKLIPIRIDKEERTKQGQSAYYDLVFRYALPPEYQPPRDEGIAVERALYQLDASTTPITSAKVGDIVRGVLTITIPEEYHAVAIEDFIPAGFEIVNTRLVTEVLPEGEGRNEGDVWREGIYNEYGEYDADPERTTTLYPSFEEFRDDRVFAFSEYITPGVYTYEYYLRALVPGTFNYLPATVSEMYFPEIFGRTAGSVFTVEE